MVKIVNKLLNVARIFESAVGDWWMNVNTRGSVYFSGTRGLNKDAFSFETNAHSTILNAIRLTKLKPSDVVFVLGCGKGRTVCHFARQKVRKVVGIEISEELCKIARSNAQRLRKKQCPIEIRNLDASIADLKEGTIFFMFNPFGEKTLHDIIKNIETTHNITTTPVTIIYCNPTCSNVFKEFPWLKVKYDYSQFSGAHIIIYKNAISESG
jgi:SAM-dependent methyltransferase